MKLILFVLCGMYYAFVQPVTATDADMLADEVEKLGDRGPLLVDNYIPVTMQILHHCIEMIQYEPTMTPPPAEAGTTPLTTTKRPTTTSSAPTPTSVATTTNKSPPESPLTTAKPADTTLFPTSPHKPGYYGPEKPPPTAVTTTRKTPSTSTTTTTETPKVNESPATTESLLWSDKPFTEWFLQSKRKKIQQPSLLDAQLLDPLPAKVLQDFNREPYEPLALRPEDNANEFRRLYDDNYRGPISVLVLEKGTKKGGKKRVPPTKPYLHMLVLYDLLKREAKKNMYSIYEGYSEAILNELYQMNFVTAKDQLHYALTQLLERKDIEKSDVVSRSKQMITDLNTRNSAITMALEVVPPLRFGL
ncbi:uncharacterized protein LOC126559856 [Anopheles maculipalpis]|uniref:uncharacterized protein LOC126559856 n=1 Tax=Anopheles maculipalpis TaxID=1496333 RepID=UPI002159A5F0|nr:uncharacterized protein LOC126559856 [Anopheles maculipalpis]